MTPSKTDLRTLKTKRLLVTGGNGMLATSFQRQLALHVPDAVVWAPPREELDVRDSTQMQAAARFAPDFVVHCAARVDADFCETDTDAARASVVGGTVNAVRLAQSTGAKFLYPQSFLVFDGSQDPITEATIPNPLSVYGRLKVEAEAAVLSTLPDAISVRMAGFFGGHAADTNFVGKIIPHLAKLIAQRTRSIEIGDRVWQPTYTDDLALNSLALLANDKRGVYCMASHGEASFFDLTREIVSCLGLSSKIEVVRIDAAKLADREKARRPLRAVIDNRRLRDDGLDLQRDWRIALAAYLHSPYFRNMLM
jgi:dTDP-4-dehydrorhamnose reductase